ncbi:MAG: AbrB/MazE/SpoVT family DNA-binding domain-containing protein [Acidobacteria bacterium]|nr:AbrB/MazE/SpoVT family DNA-binding domain-containing protein [Acidobacteriota bacterium]
MSIATMTSKGQVTVPKEIRDRIHLGAGDKLDFQLTDSGVILVRPVTRKVSDVFGCLSGKTQQTATVEEMDEAVRTLHWENWK